VRFAVGIIDANIVLLDVEPEHGQGRFGQRDRLHGDSVLAASYRVRGESGMRNAQRPALALSGLRRYCWRAAALSHGSHSSKSVTNSSPKLSSTLQNDVKHGIRGIG